MTEHHVPSRPYRRRLAVAGIAASAVGLIGIGFAAGRDDSALMPLTVAQQQTPTQTQTQAEAPTRTRPWSLTPPPTGFDPSDGSAGDDTVASEEAVDATEAQEIGLVYITSTLGDSSRAAGTGMILISDGQILTNHHVVEGATALSVEVVSTGRTYAADVVGYDATHDVAVLQLEDASGLSTVTTDTAEQVAVGDAVTGVGNANGDGGAASAATGTIIATDQSITVSDQTSAESSALTGLIEIDADIISGDSGGALYDEDGEVIGMNTAASSGSPQVTGYAVPIAQALAIVGQIESGEESDTVEIGGRGYLGIQLSSDVTGALVGGVENGSAAEYAGLAAGSTITSFNGAAVTSASALAETVAGLEVGDRVSLAWTDSSGQAHAATLTLGDGPVG